MKNRILTPLQIISTFICIVCSLLLCNCQNKTSIGYYSLDNVLNNQKVKEYKNEIVSNETTKATFQLDSMRLILQKYRDSIKNNRLESQNSFESYNQIKQLILSKERILNNKVSELAFAAQDSVYKKLSKTIKKVGKEEKLDLILPQNNYSLNYVGGKLDVTEQVIQSLISQIR